MARKAVRYEQASVGHDEISQTVPVLPVESLDVKMQEPGDLGALHAWPRRRLGQGRQLRAAAIECRL